MIRIHLVNGSRISIHHCRSLYILDMIILETNSNGNVAQSKLQIQIVIETQYFAVLTCLM